MAEKGSGGGVVDGRTCVLKCTTQVFLQMHILLLATTPSKLTIFVIRFSIKLGRATIPSQLFKVLEYPLLCTLSPTIFRILLPSTIPTHLLNPLHYLFTPCTMLPELVLDRCILMLSAPPLVPSPWEVPSAPFVTRMSIPYPYRSMFLYGMSRIDRRNRGVNGDRAGIPWSMFLYG